jgi:hypothetical protein
MKKIVLAFIVIFIISTLTVSALAKGNPDTVSPGISAKSDEVTAKNHIVIKESQDARYSDTISSNIVLLEKNIIKDASKYGFDFSAILTELKTNKKLIVSNVFNQKIENNNLKYSELINNVYDTLYSQYAKKLTTYSKDSFAELLDKYFNNQVKPGSSMAYTIIIVAQNKNTGLFISYTPINVKISAAYDKLNKEKILYTADIQSLNYLQITNN